MVKSSPSNRYYVLFVLTMLLMFNYVDRLALGIVLQDIKIELKLSDTELGFMTGLAFSIFYAVMGVPIARMADRGNRVLIISSTAILWSIAVAACALAHSFEQLLLIRVAVAVGEAGCIPPALSLIADYFDRTERPRAAALYGWGSSLAFILGFFGAGWLNELYGWRATFVLLAVPGMIVGIAAGLTLAEPRRGGAQKREAVDGTSVSFSAAIDILRKIRTFRYAIACLSVLAFFNYGILQWLPSYYVRSFQVTARDTGTYLALAYGVFTFIGSYASGELAARLAPNDEGRQLKYLSYVVAASGILLMGAFLAPALIPSLLFVSLYAMGSASINGPLYATVQTVVPDNLRATSFSLIFLASNLIGMGLGPLAVGALSDFVNPWLGTDSLRVALLCIAPGMLIGAFLIWRAGQTVSQDLGTTHPSIV